jgi:uncharacterized protein (DUF305 family)
MHPHPYRGLLLMTLLSFIAMYILMYAMVNTLGNVYNNLNEFYMAGLMSAPMPIISLALMRSMYSNKRLNALVLTASVIAAVAFFGLIRVQGAISDRQFVRSMIPHHASAILMCQQAAIQDPEIKDLCKAIISGQQAEIDQMKAILTRLDR